MQIASIPYVHVIFALHFVGVFSLSRRVDDKVYCSDATRLAFSSQRLHYSNLHGYGPHVTQPQGMLISEAFPGSTTNIKDLVITTTSSYYPQNVSLNDVHRDIASISMEAGSKAELQIGFLDRVTREASDPGHFALSFMNFAELKVSGCTRYALSENTEVQAQEGQYALTFRTEAAKISPMFAMALTDSERAASVILMCKNSQVFVEATMKQGEAGDNLYIAGASNVDPSLCPTRASCSDFSCPQFFVPSVGVEEPYCATEECISDDVQVCCDEHIPDRCENNLALVFERVSLVYSNLGGVGPDTDQEEGIRYGNVFPHSDKVIDMLINARSFYNCSNHSEHKTHPQIADQMSNGLKGLFGAITVSSASSVKVQVSFVEAGTDNPVFLTGGFFFTIYDIDQQRDNHGVESIRISGYEYFNVSANTSVQVLSNGEREGLFFSSAAGTLEDNPRNPHIMSEPQLQRSVAFAFPDGTSTFHMELSVGLGFAARTFEFSGVSALSCPAKRPCSSMSCPVGYKLKTDADNILCASSVCSQGADLHRCCRSLDELSASASCSTMLCPHGQELKNFAESLFCEGIVCSDQDTATCCKRLESFSGACAASNQLTLTQIVKIWTSQTGKQYVKFADVFPHMGRKIDLNIRFDHFENTTDDGESPGAPRVVGQLFQIALPDLPLVSASFRLIDRKTQDIAKHLPEYLITFLGGTAHSADAHRQLTFSGDHSAIASLSDDSVVLQTGSFSFLLAQVGTWQEEKLMDMSLYALPGDVRESAVSIRTNSSKFQIDIKEKPLVAGYLADRPPWGLLAREAGGKKRSSRETAQAGSLFVGGSSTLACAARATCDSFLCPSGFQLRENAENLLCEGEMCTASDYPKCCDCDSTAALLWDESSLKTSTLGDPNAVTQEILVEDVFPNWKPVNLKISPFKSFDYYPADSSKNSINGAFLDINLRSSSSSTVKFEFVSPKGELMRIPFNFVFSVFDIDQQEDGGAHSSIGVSNFLWYVLSNRTTLITQTIDGQVSFQATQAGTARNNPVNPLALTDDRLHYSASFMMESNLARFNVTMKVSDGFVGRNFLFAGQSNLVCSKREVCSNFQCPSQEVLVHRANFRTCRGEVCTAGDHVRCCDKATFDDVPAEGAKLS